MTVALAAAERPKANAALKKIVFIMVELSPCEAKPNSLQTRVGGVAKLSADRTKSIAAAEATSGGGG
jgi:hypothetical protein